MSIAFVALTMLVSCHMDNVDYVGNDGDPKKNIGYLQVAGMQAEIMADTENIDSAANTRAEGVNINNFDVVITNKAGEAVASFKYGERPTEPIALDGGIYKLTIVSESMVGAEWERPIYGAESEIIITRKPVSYTHLTLPTILLV